MEDDIYVKDPAFPHEDNWVWSPQGEIAMHLPERWGSWSSSPTPWATLSRAPCWGSAPGDYNDDDDDDYNDDDAPARR